jgi:TM2 domain-containing membrane protein YozV
MSQIATELSREKAFKLALLLGWAGMHRFYTHQFISGLAYLLFFWTLIPGLLSLIDAYFLARMSDDDFAEEFCAIPCSVTESSSAALVQRHPHSDRSSFDLTA